MRAAVATFATRNQKLNSPSSGALADPSPSTRCKPRRSAIPVSSREVPLMRRRHPSHVGAYCHPAIVHASPDEQNAKGFDLACRYRMVAP